ncbi:MAG: MFS transporter, partial [Alphaproteobacteria bacterium]|nr:MFS transporter [Alphaproteobacteria bacterium]
AEFDLVAFMVSRYFGMKNYGFLYSLQTLAMMFFAGIAPPIFGRIYDSAGSYDPILTAVGIGFLAAPLLLLTLGRYPTFAAADTDGAAQPAAA